MSIWSVTSAAEYREEMREQLDLLMRTALEYDGTLAGAYTTAAAELAHRVDQGIADALANLLLATADEAGLVARASDAGITPGAATYSRYIVEISGDGELPQGTLLRGGGELGRSRWEVVDETAIVADGDSVTIQAVDSGPVTLSGTTDLTLVAPVEGITGAQYDPSWGTDYQIGTDAESAGSLRVRIEQRGSRGGTYTSIASDLLDIDWVTAVDVRQGSTDRSIAITVVPAPVGEDRESELAAALYLYTPGGSTLEGDESLTTTSVNGDDVTVYYTEGAEEEVAVVAIVESDGTQSDADLEDAVTAAIEAYFAGLGPGDTAYYVRLAGAVFAIDALTEATELSMNAASLSVSPSLATSQLVPYPISVTVVS